MPNQLVTYLDKDHWLAESDNTLYEMHDGGKHWQPLPLPAKYQSLNSLNFVSVREGWAIGNTVSSNGTPQSQQVIGADIVHTVDGGKTWQKVDSQIQ